MRIFYGSQLIFQNAQEVPKEHAEKPYAWHRIQQRPRTPNSSHKQRKSITGEDCRNWTYLQTASKWPKEVSGGLIKNKT